MIMTNVDGELKERLKDFMDANSIGYSKITLKK